MTPKTSTGSEQSGTLTATTSTILRRELFLWLALFFFVNDILFLSAHPLDEWLGAKPGLLQAFTTKSVFYYLGWYVVVSRLRASDAVAATPVDIGFGLFVALLNMAPPHLGVWMAGTVTGLYLIVAHRQDRNLPAAGAVLIALAFNTYWGPKLFDFLADPLLRADASIVGTLLSLTQPDMGWKGTIIGNLQGHSVLVFAPCSSFHNISLGLLCWVAVTKLFRVAWVRGDLAIGLLVCLSVVVLNTIRLYLMALSLENYQYWHFGWGNEIMAWATTATVLTISLWGALRADPGQPRAQ